MVRLRFSAALTLCALTMPVSAQVINEFVADHTGVDHFSFVEIAGAPSTSYSSLCLIDILGDTTDGDDDPGTIEHVWVPGTTNANGIWVSSYGTANGSGDIDNGTHTLLLVSGMSPCVAGADLDTNNDGTLDSTPWTAIVDAIAVNDGGADFTYATPVLTVMFDGLAFEPGGASRIPNGVDTNTVGDWKRNDYSGQGLPGMSGTIDPGEVANSPGLVNVDGGGGGGGGFTPKIDEVLFDQTGVDGDEFIEIWGQISLSYASWDVLVIDSDDLGNPGEVLASFAVGTTNGGGLWSTATLSPESLPNDSVTVLLVDGFSGTLGADLDTNDDGTFDTTPWTTLSDDVALADGDGADVFYSATVLPAPVGGFSRIPSGVDTNSAADWVRNDPDGAGLPGGSSATLDAGEAWNTRSMINRVREEDYWAGIPETCGPALRAAIHDRLDDHQRYAYSSSDTDTWDLLELADEDPLDSARVVAPYKNESFLKFGGGTGPYNREHSWPQSYGFPDEALNNSPRTDAHHLFLEDVDYNSTRGNLPFGTCNSGCSEQPTDAHNSVGGQGGGYPGDSNWAGGNAYEVWWYSRGNIARAQLYMDVRYEGGNHAATGFAEPNLVLTDNTSLIQTTGSNTTGTAYMGRLTTLLQWDRDDPVDAWEERRNDVVWAFQGNRNPFIDHPEWVTCIFRHLFSDGFEGGDTGAWSAVGP